MTFSEFASHIDLYPILYDGKARLWIYDTAENDNILLLKPHRYTDLGAAVADYGERKLNDSKSVFVFSDKVTFWLK